MGKKFEGFMMDNVLVVDDDRVILRVLEKKVKEVGFRPICCDSMKMALEKAKDETIFAALLDLNLPDAPNGEVVDEILALKIPSIILTSLYDDDVRIKMTSKNIVDYVIKNREESFDYAVSYVKKLKGYSKQKALIVEDSSPQRLYIKRLVSALLFEVYEAQNGVEALEIMEKHPDIKLVITDYYMPEMDGYDLTIKLRKKYKEDNLVILALTGHDSKETSSKFLKFGASDYLPKPFTKEELNYRIIKKMDVLSMLGEIKEYAEQLKFANESIKFANQSKLRYIQTIEEYLDIIDRHVLMSRSDLDGNITYVSNAFLKLTGYEWSELVGHNHRKLRHPDTPKETYVEMWEMITQNKAWKGTLKNVAKSGEVFCVDVTISPYFDQQNEKEGYVAFRTNVVSEKSE